MSSPSTIDLSSPTPANGAQTAAELSSTAANSSAPTLLLCMPSITVDGMSHTLATIGEAFPGERILVASPDHTSEEDAGSIRLIPYAGGRAQPGWILSAADYLSAANIARERKAATTLLIGADATTLSAITLRNLADGVRGHNADLAVPKPSVGPNEGLVTSALLYPLTRALFGVDIHFPLPSDTAFSQRMAQRLATVAQRQASTGDGALVWAVPEAAIAGYSVREIDVPERGLPQPSEGDFNTLFTDVASSLFADIEAKAAFWQRARSISAPRPTKGLPSASAAEASPEIHSLVDGFHLAYASLQEIWSLVLPPQTLLALKRLSMAAAETFSIAPNLWARIVYDFALAFHLRTINRGHLMGALTPLYLAWVASHLHATEANPANGPAIIATGATAFELEKPYLVSRWRWPDRFNP